MKNRPRIPTPDVSKEGLEKDRFNLTPVTITTTHPSLSYAGHQANGSSSVASGVTLMAQQLQTSVYTGMNSNDVPMVGTLLLSPISELDSGSVHNTLQAGSPTTNALANAVLPATLQTSTDWRSNSFFFSLTIRVFLIMHLIYFLSFFFRPILCKNQYVGTIFAMK